MAKSSNPAESAAQGARAIDGAPAALPEVELKDPVMAVALAWLIPGLGHWYQGRRSKALLFFVCIMGTFIYGLYLGEGRVVYASWRPNDKRLPFLCQMGVGVPAITAVVQARRDNPIPFPGHFMVPPKIDEDRQFGAGDELDQLQKRLHRFWELGTVYTMIAGLLNILAMYDAWGGPAFVVPPQKAKKDDEPEPGDAGQSGAAKPSGGGTGASGGGTGGGG
ncbi:MAG: DUF6677 family protein [Pirellulales bacterium]